jgi:hypothetical protein
MYWTKRWSSSGVQGPFFTPSWSQQGPLPIFFPVRQQNPSSSLSYMTVLLKGFTSQWEKKNSFDGIGHPGFWCLKQAKHYFYSCCIGSAFTLTRLSSAR